MGAFLGALAGGGMLLLIGALMAVFFKQMGWLRQEGIRLLLRGALITGATGCVYWLSGALISQTVYGGLESVADPAGIFRGPYVQDMLEALKEPGGQDVISGVFAYLGHGLGAVLLGQFILGGMLLAFLCVLGGVTLVMARARKLWGQACAEALAWLILWLPFGVFLFLPGWPPLAFLLIAMGFFILGKKEKPRQIVCGSSAFKILWTVCVLVSMAVTAAVALGKIG